MFIFTMWIVLQNRRRRRLNHGMVGAACAILALSTAVRRDLLRTRVPGPGPDRHTSPEIAAAEHLIRSGELHHLITTHLGQEQP